MAGDDPAKWINEEKINFKTLFFSVNYNLRILFDILDLHMYSQRVTLMASIPEVL